MLSVLMVLLACCISLPCFYGLSCGLLSLASRCRFCASIFHALAPCDTFFSVPHEHYCFRWYQIDVVHFVAIGTEDGQIFHSIVSTITVKVSHFQNLRDSEPTVSADRGIFVECEFSVIDARYHGFVQANVWLKGGLKPVPVSEANDLSLLLCWWRFHSHSDTK